MTYYYYRASSIEFGQVPLAIYTETSTETRLANTEKTQEKRMARDGETGRARWRTDESCREQPDSVEEASLSSHLSLGTLSKVVVYLEVLVPVCDMYRGCIVVTVNGRGDRICSEGIGFASSSRTWVYADVCGSSPCVGSRLT